MTMTFSLLDILRSQHCSCC